ncbi:putative 2-oxoglutarate-dependent dioxygenase DIN11, partial [Lachnellula suecica]
MTEPQKNIVKIEQAGLKAHGIFSKGETGVRSQKPLIVLIHGGGTNATYFDNSFHSIPKAFNAAGFDTLNIHRVGYGGNPAPETATPIIDSIPLYSSLIKKAYDENSGGQNGIILVGHSLGAAISLSLAAFEGDKLPLLGVSSLGIMPTKDHPPSLIEMLKANPENPRFIVEPSIESIETFMGPLELIDESLLIHPSMPNIFEPGLKSEMLEWFDPIWYNRFVNEVAPKIRVPVQFLAAEYELQWKGIAEGQPIFDQAASLFTRTSRLDARILIGGGHNFEFSKNASVLQEARDQFISSLVTPIPKPIDPAVFAEIPLLDFALASDPATKPQFLDSLRNAIVNVGFLYIKNTTVSDSTQGTLTQKGIEALELPLEEKLKIEMANSKHFLGYARLGTEITAMKSDYREQYDFATEVPAPGPDEPAHRNLRGPNQWPDESVIPGFRAAVENYLNEIATFAVAFSHLIAESLDMPATSFEKFFETPQHNKLKLVKYPAPP